MILELLYKCLQTQEKSFVYHMRTDDLNTLNTKQISFYIPNDLSSIDLEIGDIFFLLDGCDQKRYGSLIVKDVIIEHVHNKKGTLYEIKSAVFDVPINIGIPAACRNDRALIVRTSDTVVMLRKIINYILKGESNV